MIPFYIAGNLHCLGMCGPLAMVIGSWQGCGYYLWGRICSFTLAGVVAGGFGYVVTAVLAYYQVTGLFSLILGAFFCFSAVCVFLGKQIAVPFLNGWIGRLQVFMQRWMRQGAGALFGLGFFSIALPCGQTIWVYSLCALSGSAWVGAINGLAFALLTTPALLFAMQARRLAPWVQQWYRPLWGCSLLVVGIAIVWRGFNQL